MKKALIYIFAAMSLGACGSIHNFPDGDMDPGMVVVNLDLGIDMNFEGEITRQTYASYASMLEGDYDIRYTVEIYRDPGNANAELTERTARIVRTSDVVITEGTVQIAERLRMAAAKYVALVWVDFVAKGSVEDLNYNTEKLTAVSVIKPGGTGTGYDTTKDAFCGSVEMDLQCFCGVRFTDYTVTCPTRRPLALYRVITTDIEEYTSYHKSPAPYSSIRPATTDLLYRLYFPMGYNVQFEEPKQYTAGIGYSFDIEEIDSGREAIIASDFVLVSADTYFHVDFEMRDAAGNLINSVGGLKINLKRNMITIIRDEFLTKNFNGGGVGIDGSFDGDEIIVRID